MKLKTLEDIIRPEPGQWKNQDYEDLAEELRQEVIKWIKSDSPMLNDNDGAVEDWIKHFFNIKASELK